MEAIVSEVDSKTETIKVTIMGSQIEFESISKVIEKYGASIKGIDEVSSIKNESY